MTTIKQYSWIGDDCPPNYKRVGTIDVADPAAVDSALNRGRRIGSIYDGYSGSVAEPCAADTYITIEQYAREKRFRVRAAGHFRNNSRSGKD